MDLVGRAVSRKFRGSEISKGVVESYDTSTGFFKIKYGDGDSEELDVLNATSLLQSVPGEEKRRRIRDDPGKGFGNSVDNDDVQSWENSAGEIGGTRNLYDGVTANGVDLNVSLDLKLNEGLSLEVGAKAGVDARQNSWFRGSIDLNSSAMA